MIYVIAEIYDGIDLYGYRILDSETEEVKEYRHEDIAKEIKEGRIKIANIGIENDRAVLIGEYKYKYPKMDTEHKIHDKSIVIVLERTSLIDYKCADYTGRTFYMTVNKLVKIRHKLAIVNGDIKNDMEIVMEQTYTIDLDKVKYLEEKLASYKAKVNMIGGTPLNIDIVGDEAVIFPVDDEYITDCIIPSFASIIWPKAFAYCENITSVFIPNNIRFIGNDAFSFCEGITEVHMENGEITLDKSVFYGCKKLSDIKLSSKLKEIPINTFHGCSRITHIEIPDSITEIEAYAFDSCTKLKSIKLPNIGIISKSVFTYCSGLETVEIPEGVKEIQSEAFMNCSSLNKVVLPSTIEKIHPRAFKYIEDTVEILIPKGIKPTGIENLNYTYID